MRRFFWLTLLLVGCSSSPSLPPTEIRRRVEDPSLFLSPVEEPLPSYPWRERFEASLPAITAARFQCRGDRLHPPQAGVNEHGEETILRDCGGAREHGLPAIHGAEGVYPILLTLLNHIQNNTGHPVVITCGHRCPQHNTYADSSVGNRTSKHQIGAEVDFYVKGIPPGDVLNSIFDFYKEEAPELSEFKRYSNPNLNISTPPWFNKEIFIKLYLPHEGRDGDNTHTRPYFGIQVRWDRETDERVVYNWHTARRYYRR